MTPITSDIKPTIEEKMADSLRKIVTLQNEKEQAEKNHEKELDDIFAEVLTVIDTFQRNVVLIKKKMLRRRLSVCLMRKRKRYRCLKNSMSRELNLKPAWSMMIYVLPSRLNRIPIVKMEKSSLLKRMDIPVMDILFAGQKL